MKDRKLEITTGPGGWVQAQWRLQPPLGQRVRSPWRRAWLRFERKGERWEIAETRLFGWEALRPGELPALLFRNALNASDVAQEQLVAALDVEPSKDVRDDFKDAKPGHGPLVRLERPPGRRLDADFYKQVAAVYRDAIARGSSPRKRIQEDTGAAQDTAASWIKRARKLGYLPPAQPGKITPEKVST
jgi:hypothetical protein